VIEPACADTCLRRSRDRQAAYRQPAMVRQILGHLGIPLPSRAYRSPPVRRTPDSCGEPANGLAVHEVPEWTYGPVEDDLPLPDPLTI
jgi:hypothetical protein